MKEWNTTTLNDLTKVPKFVFEYTGIHKNKEGATVIALHGDLGAGKTTFVQMLAKEFGVSETVTSPTFVIMKMYETAQGNMQHFVHIDAYRIDSVDEMSVLNFESLLAQKDTIICIEWAERITELLPEHTIHMRFTINGESRNISLS